MKSTGVEIPHSPIPFPFYPLAFILQSYRRCPLHTEGVGEELNLLLHNVYAYL